jgi:hypothetical protein
MGEEFTGSEDDSLRSMVQLLKHIFDEAILAGFSQIEAMQLTSLTLQSFLGQAIDNRNNQPS